MGGDQSKSVVERYEATPNGRVVYGAGLRGARRSRSEEGIAGTACGMSKAQLDADLQAYLLDSSFPRGDGRLCIFGCSGDELLTAGFARCVDYPSLPEHVYYEGYFHARATADAVDSLNPRWGNVFAKPAAPTALRAFYAAFRQKNRAKFASVVEQLAALAARTAGDEDRAAVELLARLFEPDGGALVADLAVQVHCGAAVPLANVGWHTDTVNSIFHLATSVAGSRQLYSYLHAGAALPDYSAWRPYCDALAQGDVYVSSPAFFRHGVAYPQCDWQQRTVAIQARFLLDVDDYRVLRAVANESLVADLAAVVADAVAAGFDWPTLAEVKAVAATLADYTGPLALDNPDKEAALY